MAGKFSLLTTLTLNAAGFNSGIEKSKQKTADFSKGVETAGKSVKQSFAGLTGVAGGLGESLNSSLGGLPSMLSGALSGFRTMIPAITSVKTVLISSGIGIIIVALGVAFGALTTYLSGTSEGAMKVKEMFGYISGAATALMNRLKSLGSALFSILTGDIEGFKNAISEAFKGGFIDEVIEGAKQGNSLATEQNRLKKEKNLLDSEELDVLYRQAELTKKAKDVTKESNYSAKQRLDFEKEAVRIGDEFDEKKMKHLKDSWNLEVNLNKQKNQLNQSDIEKELASKKAYFDYVIKDQQDAIGENKIIAKTQKEIDSSAIDAAKERIRLEKEIGTVRMSGLLLAKNSFDDKGKLKTYNKPKVENLETKKLEEYNTKIYQSATHQQYLFDGAKTGWDMIKEQIGSTQYLTEQFGNAINGLSDAFEGLFEGTAGGFKNVVTSMLEGIKQIINALLAQAIAGMIANGGKGGIPGLLIAGAIGLPMLLGLWKSKVPEFANGGIVGGTSYSGDKITARLNSAEMVLNQKQQSNLFAMANGSGSYGGGEVRFEIEGNKLVGVLNNYNKKVRNTR